MLDSLVSSDEMATAFPIEAFDVFRERMLIDREIIKKMKKTRGTEAFPATRKERRAHQAKARKDMIKWLGHEILRRVYTPSPMRERLVFFWGDHFTATGKRGILRRATSPYIEEAIRPNIAGRFEDLLIPAVTHPLMLNYLDQFRSVGPNSQRGVKSKGQLGLNENLAREILELHTLGVNGAYTQIDVRQLAELLTGLSYTANDGLVFRYKRAEPGAETVLGKTYGDNGRQTMDPIRAVLRDLANHPTTARHVSSKLAVHFISDTPAPDLVDQMTEAYLRTDGNLMSVYAAMLDHPTAWSTTFRNAKLPLDFVSSSCRALVVAPGIIQDMRRKDMRRIFFTPMANMGHIWQQPTGPDGLAEADTNWITPQGLAARIEWAMNIPQRLKPELPDPRVFVTEALGSFADSTVRFAAGAAENKTEAIGLVLSSPAFQYR